ncbi:MAG: nuclear transport factor 2 family protein [Calothrix sp. C42_A2020_038]|nr:nuclear transport factor 2 family protein [Calothrix sp. C42_A2020_038]
MPNFINLLLRRSYRTKVNQKLTFFLLVLSLFTGWQCVQASTAQNAPAELKNLLTQIDTAANQGNVKAVMQYYSPSFTHGDGLTRQAMEKALVSLWQRHPKLRYTTQLQSWRRQGNIVIAETVTQISGAPSANSQNMALNATIRSEQRISGQQIVQQNIISERTQLTSGAKPPQIDFKLPQQVKVGQQFSFDAIVSEPLGDDYLLGAALEEPVKADTLLKPSSVNLQLLSAGGLFKIGRAPATPGDTWVSAVIMRSEGTTMVTQRLRIVK